MQKCSNMEKKNKKNVELLADFPLSNHISELLPAEFILILLKHDKSVNQFNICLK